MPKKEEFFTIKSIEQIMKLQKVKAQIEAIQKWDGQLPNVTGEPFHSLMLIQPVVDKKRLIS